MDDIWMIKEKLGMKNLNKELTPMMTLILSNSMLANSVEDGYFIGRQKFMFFYDLRNIKREWLTFRTSILNRRELKDSSYMSCKSEVYMDGQIYGRLLTSLIKNSSVIDQVIQNKDLANFPRIKLASFSPEQVKAFSHWSHDRNSIHDGENPIVQGMLLLLILEDYLLTKKISVITGDIKYLKPIRAYEDIYIEHINNRIIGLVNHQQCFLLNYKNKEYEKCMHTKNNK